MQEKLKYYCDMCGAELFKNQLDFNKDRIRYKIEDGMWVERGICKECSSIMGKMNYAGKYERV